METNNEGFFKRFWKRPIKLTKDITTKTPERDLNADINKETVEGKGVIDRIIEKTLTYPSLAIGVDDRKVEGVSLTFKEGDNTRDVDFPRKFSKPEQKVILGYRAQYKMVHTSFYEGPAGYIEGYNYRLKMIDGPEKNWELVEKITI